MDVPDLYSDSVEARLQFGVGISDHPRIITVDMGLVEFVQHHRIDPVIVQGSNEVVSDPVPSSVDAEVIGNIGKEPGVDVGDTSRYKEGVVHEKFDNRELCVGGVFVTDTAYNKIFKAAVCIAVTVITIVRDFSRTKGVVDVFGDVEFKAEFPAVDSLESILNPMIKHLSDKAERYTTGR
jgi:hypothetical protein